MLYIVSTPIGNLDDLSIRQGKTLISSDYILAEDTRSAFTLLQAIKKKFPQLNNLNKNPKLISYYKEKELEKLPEIINLLKKNKNISLISQSGTPLISDPGFLLVSYCLKKNLPITVIPGSTAFINALILSGFDPNQFMFLGFLPKKTNEKIKLFKNLKIIKNLFPKICFIFYESPLRVNESFQCFKKLNWNPDIVIARELTKKFEEVFQGKPENFINKKFKGEIVLLIK